MGVRIKLTYDTACSFSMCLSACLSVYLYAYFKIYIHMSAYLSAYRCIVTSMCIFCFCISTYMFVRVIVGKFIRLIITILCINYYIIIASQLCHILAGGCKNIRPSSWVQHDAS